MALRVPETLESVEILDHVAVNGSLADRKTASWLDGRKLIVSEKADSCAASERCSSKSNCSCKSRIPAEGDRFPGFRPIF